MRKGDVGQAGQSRRATAGTMRGRGGRRFGGSLERVIFSFGQPGQMPRSSEENGSGSLDISGGRRAGCPHVKKRAAQDRFVELGESRLDLHGGSQKSGEEKGRRKSILGPRRGPRRRTTTTRGHSIL